MGRPLVLALGWAALLCFAPSAAKGQAIVSSSAPEAVSVTVYRDPNRSPEQAPNLQFLNGYALISESRRISIPAGESDVRFEGVASGILPQSAIVGGFPEGIVERNRDAYLLSPGTLLDRSLGRRVHLRRTSLATGEVREQEAVIRSGADGAVVLQTADGFEALRCTGIPETLVYDQVPGGLSTRPTLSVRVRSSAPLAATVTLSYLATNFDWQANYVASLSDDGRLNLFAWVTLASNDDTSFVAANTQAVAGDLNREDARVEPAEARALNLECWPAARTSDIPLEEWGAPPPAPPPPPMMAGEAIMVTGSRIDERAQDSASPVTVISAEQEDLGDVKLYRIPEPVTVAANSQKQVAFLQRPRVEAGLVYRRRLDPVDVSEPQPSQWLLVTRNRDAEGLGIPLPAGRLVLFASARDRPILLGEGFLRDRAVGEDVEVELGEAVGVFSQVELVAEGKDWNEYRLTVTNDHVRPVRFEAEFDASESDFRPRRRLARRDGRPLWRVTVPANGTVTLRYRVPAGDD